MKTWISQLLVHALLPSVVLPVQHLGGGSLQLLQDLQQLSVVVTEASPAQHSGQVVTCAQRQHAQLALRKQTILSLHILFLFCCQQQSPPARPQLSPLLMTGTSYRLTFYTNWFIGLVRHEMIQTDSTRHLFVQIKH